MKNAGVDAFDYWITYGKNEGRKSCWTNKDTNGGITITNNSTLRIVKAIRGSSFHKILTTNSTNQITWSLVLCSLPSGYALDKEKGSIDNFKVTNTANEIVPNPGMYTFTIKATPGTKFEFKQFNLEVLPKEDLRPIIQPIIGTSLGFPREYAVNYRTGGTNNQLFFYSVEENSINSCDVTGGTISPCIKIGLNEYRNSYEIYSISIPLVVGKYKFTFKVTTPYGSDTNDFYNNTFIPGATVTLNAPTTLALEVGKPFSYEFSYATTGNVDKSLIIMGINSGGVSGITITSDRERFIISGAQTTAGTYNMILNFGISTLLYQSGNYNIKFIVK